MEIKIQRAFGPDTEQGKGAATSQKPVGNGPKLEDNIGNTQAELVAPKVRKAIVTVVNRSKTFLSEGTGNPYRMVTLKEGDTIHKAIPVSDRYGLDEEENSLLQVGAVLEVELVSNIEGKTHLQSDESTPAEVTGLTIGSIATLTKADRNLLELKSMQKVLESAENPVIAGYMVQLMQAQITAGANQK